MEIEPKDFFLAVAGDDARPLAERVQATIVLQRMALQALRAPNSEQPEPPKPPVLPLAA